MLGSGAGRRPSRGDRHQVPSSVTAAGGAGLTLMSGSHKPYTDAPDEMGSETLSAGANPPGRGEVEAYVVEIMGELQSMAARYGLSALAGDLRRLVEKHRPLS